LRKINNYHSSEHKLHVHQGRTNYERNQNALLGRLEKNKEKNIFPGFSILPFQREKKGEGKDWYLQCSIKYILYIYIYIYIYINIYIYKLKKKKKKRKKKKRDLCS